MKRLLMVLIFLLASPCVHAQKKVAMGLPFHVNRIKAIAEYQRFLSEALKEAGFTLEIKVVRERLPYDLLVGGELDSIMYDDLGLRKDRQKTVSTSFPIIKTRSRYFHLKNNPQLLDRKYKDKTISSLRGCVIMANYLIEKEVRRRGFNFIHAGSQMQCINTILDGKADYFIAIEEVGRSALESTPGAKDKFTVSDTVFLEVPLYLTFHKKFQPDLPRIEASLKKKLTGDLSGFPLIATNLNKMP